MTSWDSRPHTTSFKSPISIFSFASSVSILSFRSDGVLTRLSFETLNCSQLGDWLSSLAVGNLSSMAMSAHGFGFAEVWNLEMIALP